MKKIFTNKWFIGIAVIIVAALVCGILFSKSNNSLQKITVTRGDVVQDVQISGKTKAVSSVDLAFQSAGKIVAVYADVGARVKKGDTVAVLDQAELSANKDQSIATLASEEARLRELQRGARPEELAIATTAYADATQGYVSALKQSYSSLDDIVRSQIDQFFNGGQTGAPSFKPYAGTVDLRDNIEKGRYTIENFFVDWGNIPGITATSSSISAHAAFAHKIIDATGVLLDNIGKAVSNQTFNTDADRAILSAARTSYDALVATINASEEKYNTAQKNLVLKQNGSSQEEIDAQVAKVEQARAGVGSIGAKMSSYVIVSPIDGVVTRQDAKVGEMAQAGVSVMSVISAGNLEIEAYVPEVNIGKVSVGNLVTITLDALSGESFTGKVLYIDPAETVLDGVVNYKTKVSLDSSDERIRSGLTANLTVHSAERKAVIAIPRYAVSTVGDTSTVKKFLSDASDVTTTPVTLGLQGSDGNVEIVSGLAEGDVIVVNSSAQ